MFGNTDSVGEITLRGGRTGVGRPSSATPSHRREICAQRRRDRHTDRRRRWFADRRKGCSNVPTSQGVLATTQSCTGRKHCPQSLPRGRGCADTLMCDFLSPELQKDPFLCHLKPARAGAL